MRVLVDAPAKERLHRVGDIAVAVLADRRDRSVLTQLRVATDELLPRARLSISCSQKRPLSVREREAPGGVRSWLWPVFLGPADGQLIVVRPRLSGPHAVGVLLFSAVTEQ